MKSLTLLQRLKDLKRAICEGCGSFFVIKVWWQRACSKKCQQRLYRKMGIKYKHLKGSGGMKGRKQKETSRQKISLALRKDNAPQWKGVKASYISKHWWNIKWWGNPKRCEHCGLKGRRINGHWNIDWANISGTYLRERSDWLGLCRKCHIKYDGKSKHLNLWGCRINRQ